jgi:hypothetical protein
MIKMGQNRQHLDKSSFWSGLSLVEVSMIIPAPRTIFSRGQTAGRMNLPPANDVIADKQLASRSLAKSAPAKTAMARESPNPV